MQLEAASLKELEIRDIENLPVVDPTKGRFGSLRRKQAVVCD
jgi:hypothetical protein